MPSESSISVAVRVRPFSSKERQLLAASQVNAPTLFSTTHSTPTQSSSNGIYSTPQPQRLQNTPGGMRKIVKVLDERILVFDPPDPTSAGSASFSANAGRIAGQMPALGKKVKDIRFCFDRVFDEDCGQEDVYEGSAKELVVHVMDGFNSTVFAYGATGCGKTHTISGSSDQPGVVFLIMKDLFARMQARSDDTDFALKVSYLEIYNETIRDLLDPESGTLQLRENGGMANVANLSTKEPSCAADVVGWITEGNMNRTVNATEANATSSRSHAVLQVTITQKPKAEGLTDSQSSAILSIIDLAGSERASVTKNKGDRLIEGANINRSLLALGNCINALCDPRKHGHVPYRDSKLTRLLKPSLGGNCKTVMIVCVSPASVHYDETHNTLQYANRAKEIKTKAIRNVISVDRHVAQYCQQIMLQAEQIKTLEAKLEATANLASTADRDEDVREVASYVRRLAGAWETSRLRRAEAAQAAAEKTIVDSMLNTLQSWRSTAFEQYDSASSPSGSSTVAASSVISIVRTNCDGLIGTLSSQSAMLRGQTAKLSDGSDTFASTLSGLTSTIKSKRPSALPLFELEAKLLDQRIATSVAEARERGNSEGTKMQARVMHAMCEARVKVGAAVDSAKEEGADSERALQRLASGIDNANRDAFNSLSAGVSFVGTKRDAGSRSPLQMDDMWAKSPRSALSGLGSTPGSTVFALSPARPVVNNYRRSSPKKGVAFPLRAGRASASPKKQRKEVQWRDETGDGDLAVFKNRSPSDIDKDSSMIVDVPSLKVTSWASSSNVDYDGESSSAAAEMAQKARLSAGPNRVATSRLSPLPRASNVNGSFFVRGESSQDSISMPPPSLPFPASASISRNPFADVGNTSMASTSSGLVAPIKALPSISTASPSLTLTPEETPERRAARRNSNIGPQRSAKSNRRTSTIGIPPLLPTPMSSSANHAPSSAGTFNFATSARRATRVSSVPLVPLSARRSPRKLVSLGGTSSAVNRRLSTLPATSLSASTPNSNGFVFGAKSAARIASRRESSLASMTNKPLVTTANGGRNSGGGNGSSGLLGVGSRRDSPSGNGIKPNALPVSQWR